MIGYVTIGSNDPDASGKFYDAVFGEMGAERKFRDGDWIGYGMRGDNADSHSVYVCPPFNKEKATFGNGTMIAFKAASKAEVNAAHKAGLANGGTDEGAPGPRPPDSTTYYGGYMRDPVGNKICVYCKP
jgi:catechol 2,3-dioxygenase-like lactoylglutathione lyase family enzyme